MAVIQISNAFLVTLFFLFIARNAAAYDDFGEHMSGPQLSGE